MYESIGLKKELKQDFNLLKGNLEIIYPNSLTPISANGTMKFITELLSEENLNLIMSCKKTLLKSDSSMVDISYHDLLKRIMEYYK